MLTRCTLFMLLVLFGCDQVGSKTQGVAILTHTPDLSTSTGLSSELAAVLPLDQLTNNGATAVAFALGERDSLSSANITGLSSANITIAWLGVTVGLCAQSTAGTYAATSVASAACGDARLTYIASTQYTFDIGTTGEQYTVRITAPTILDSANILFDPVLTALTDTNGAALPRHDRDTSLKVDWSRAVVSEPAFITVFRIDYVGGEGEALQANSWRMGADNPVYDNAPTSISDYVTLVLDDTPTTSFTIPRETFDTQGLYLTIVTPVAVSTDVSSNLSLGSGAVAGAGTTFVFWVQ